MFMEKMYEYTSSRQGVPPSRAFPGSFPASFCPLEIAGSVLIIVRLTLARSRPTVPSTSVSLREPPSEVL